LTVILIFDKDKKEKDNKIVKKTY